MGQSELRVRGDSRGVAAASGGWRVWWEFRYCCRRTSPVVVPEPRPVTVIEIGKGLNVFLLHVVPFVVPVLPVLFLAAVPEVEACAANNDGHSEDGDHVAAGEVVEGPALARGSGSFFVYIEEAKAAGFGDDVASLVLDMGGVLLEIAASGLGVAVSHLAWSRADRRGCGWGGTGSSS